MAEQFDIGKVMEQAMHLKEMKRRQAAAPLDAQQRMLPFLQVDPNTQFNEPTRGAFSGMAGGTPFESLQGAMAPIIKQQRTNELRKSLAQARRSHRTQAASNESMAGMLLEGRPDREDSLRKFRAYQNELAKQSLMDIISEYPDMQQDPGGQQLIKQFVDELNFNNPNMLPEVLGAGPQKR